MKRIFFVLLLFMILISCTLVVDEKEIAFEKVSQSYLDKYGYPEKIVEYKSEEHGYHGIDWWWKRGFMVSFLNIEQDKIKGWKVNYTFSFDIDR